MVRDICSEVRKTVDIPIGVKLMFNFLDPSPMFVPKEVGLDWVTSCIAIPAAPGISLDQMEPSIPSSVFLSGSKAAKHLNFVSLLTLSQQCKDIHISATGGAQGWSDVIEYIMYGASSVQIQTLFLQKGLGIIEGMKNEISSYMNSKRFSSIDEMKGTIFPKLVSFHEAISTYAQTKGKIVASVDPEKCTGCGSCEDLCNWDALRVTDGALNVLKENCEGCGVCVCACPEEALRLDNIELIRKLARS
jgi:NAD-dependent dihydropyrimidine dehydrogenase PreA subunit